MRDSLECFFEQGLVGKGSGKEETSLIRRHFLELTQSFVIPLERYMASLMPLQKSISPFKVCNAHSVMSV